MESETPVETQRSYFNAPFVAHVWPHDDYTLTLTFENGEVRRFDLKPYMDSVVFAPLHDLELFRRVKVVYGSIEWPGERDLAHDMLYAKSIPSSAPDEMPLSPRGQG